MQMKAALLKPILVFLLLVIVPGSFLGRALQGLGQAGALAAVQGHWVDVNSDCVLDIRGDRLIVSHTNSGWKESYRCRLSAEGNSRSITGVDDDGFGVLSSLDIRDDCLSAYERILDGPSRTYRFVREENLAKELEIRDLSSDKPKTIESKEITEFSLSFFNGRGRDYGLDETWPKGAYSWEIAGDADGGYQMDFRVMGDSYIELDFSQAVDAQYARGLADRIAEMNIAAFNGYHKLNNVNAPGYSLYAEYSSGETLSILAGGDAAASCVFDLPALLNYAAEQDLFRDAYGYYGE